MNADLPNIGAAPVADDRTDKTSTIAADTVAADTVAIPLMEEQVRVAKRETVTGKVRVRTVVDTTEKLVRQELDTEHVSVVRVPVDRYVDAAPQVRTEGNTTIIPILEEVLVVETKLLLKEEVHIVRTSSKETVEQPVRLRKQRAIVEQLTSDAESGEHPRPSSDRG